MDDGRGRKYCDGVHRIGDWGFRLREGVVEVGEITLKKEYFMTVYVEPPQDASSAVKDVCTTIEHLFNGRNSKIILEDLDEKLSKLNLNEKEQLRQSIISKNHSQIQAINIGERSGKSLPTDSSQVMIGQIDLSSLPFDDTLPFDDKRWKPLLDLFKKHGII